MRAFRPQIERLRHQISCCRQSEAVIDTTRTWGSIKDRSRIDDERMRTMRSFCYRFACKQIVALRIHRGAQFTLDSMECQQQFNRSVQQLRADMRVSSQRTLRRSGSSGGYG
jgi:hypothetical protein